MDLAPAEVRVLGCLVEKELATPQAYPLTLNALRLACNQATGRDPVVAYDDRVVEGALGQLRARGLTRVLHSRSNRAAKHRHVLDEAWGLDVPQRAVLAVLALRGPQTLGELKARTDRLHAFADLAEVEVALDQLAEAGPGALVERQERRPGQKDARWAALLGPVPATPAEPPAGGGAQAPVPAAPPPPRPEVGELARLRADLDELRAEFDAFRARFG